MHSSVRYKFGTKRHSNCSRAVFMKRFYFFILKTDHFWSLHVISKKWTLKRKFSDSLGKCIYRLFQVLAQFIFTTSETELDYHDQKVNVRVASWVAEWLKTLDLKKLKNFKKTSEILRFDSEHPACHQKSIFWHLC